MRDYPEPISPISSPAPSYVGPNFLSFCPSFAISLTSTRSSCFIGVHVAVAFSCIDVPLEGPATGVEGTGLGVDLDAVF